MNEKYIDLAEKFLLNHRIDYAKPGEVGLDDDVNIEIIFPVPEALDPNVAVVDPPDVRVLINKMDGKCELVPQM